MAYKTKSEIEEEYKRKIEKIRQEKAEAIGRATARDRKAETQAKIRIGGVVLKVLRESYEKHVEEEMATSGKSRADFAKLDARDVDLDRLLSFLRGQENRGGYLTAALGFPSAAGAFERSAVTQRKNEEQG